jgi:hypothetical protein
MMHVLHVVCCNLVVAQFLHAANVLDVPSGTIKYKGAKIQLLDLPGIIEGAKDGKGRGRQARFSSGVPAVIESTEREAGGWARRHGVVQFTYSVCMYVCM